MSGVFISPIAFSACLGQVIARGPPQRFEQRCGREAYRATTEAADAAC